MHMLEVQEGDLKENWSEAIFVEITCGNFPKLKEEISSPVQETQ